MNVIFNLSDRSCEGLKRKMSMVKIFSVGRTSAQLVRLVIASNILICKYFIYLAQGHPHELHSIRSCWIRNILASWIRIPKNMRIQGGKYHSKTVTKTFQPLKKERWLQMILSLNRSASFSTNINQLKKYSWSGSVLTSRAEMHQK